MEDNSKGRSIAELAMAYRRDVPRLAELLAMPDAARQLADAVSLELVEASRLLVDELMRNDCPLALFEAFKGGHVEEVSRHCPAMEPDAIPHGSTLTHYPSARDLALNGLPLRLTMGNHLGDARHPEARRAAGLCLVKREFIDHFIVDLLPKVRAMPLSLVHISPAPAAPAPAAPEPMQPGGSKWTQSHKDAMHADRRAGLSDTAIAKKNGITRQRLGQLIGTKSEERREQAQMQGQAQARKG